MPETGGPEPWTVLRGHGGEVQALDFLDRRHLFSGDSDGCVRLWDLLTRRPVYEANLHPAQAGILGLQVGRAPNGVILLFSAGRDGQLLAHAVTQTGSLSSRPLFAVSTDTYGFCRPHATLISPAGPSGNAPSAMQCSGWLVACAGDTPGHVHVWDTRSRDTHQPSIALPPPAVPKSAPVAGAEPHAPGSILAPTVGQTTCVQFIQPASNQPATARDVQPAQGCDPCSTSGHVLVGYESGSLALWDLRAPSQPMALVARAHTEPVLCCCVCPSGGEAVTGSADNALRMWELGAQGQVLQAGVTHSLPAPGVAHIAWRADGRVLAAGGWDGKVRVYSGKAGHKPLAVLRHHSKEAAAVAWAPGPSTECVSSGSPVDPELGLQGSGEGHGGVPWGMLASGSRDSSIALWQLYDWASGKGKSMVLQ